jgi:hypothetical protein
MGLLVEVIHRNPDFVEKSCHFGYLLHRNADSAEKSLSVNRYIVPEMRLASDPQSSLGSDSPEGHSARCPKGCFRPGARR